MKQVKTNFEQEKFENLQKEKLIEKLNEKILSEQNQNEKIQQELSQLKQDLKNIHSKYDTLQVEVLQLREAKTNEPIQPVTTRLMRSKRSANEEVAFTSLFLLSKFLGLVIGYTR